MAGRKNAARPKVSRRTFIGGASASLMAAAWARDSRGDEKDISKREIRGDDHKKILLACVGGEWPDHGPLEPIVESVTQKDGYRLERITYRVEAAERIAAYLLVPDGANKDRK